ARSGSPRGGPGRPPRGATARTGGVGVGGPTPPQGPPAVWRWGGGGPAVPVLRRPHQPDLGLRRHEFGFSVRRRQVATAKEGEAFVGPWHSSCGSGRVDATKLQGRQPGRSLVTKEVSDGSPRT